MGLIKSLILFTGLTLGLVTQAQEVVADKVLIKTDLGDLTVQLYPQKAPKTVAQFLENVNSYFYDGLIFHRVMDGFIIQTGGYWFDFRKKEPKTGKLVNESFNGLFNHKGTLAMARFAEPDSANAQFFINLKDNPHLDPKKEKPGYTVFGRIIEGFEVAEKIGKLKTHRASAELSNVPVELVQIQSISVIKNKPTTESK